MKKDVNKTDSILRATHGSIKKPINLNDTNISCYVLENKQRVLSGRGMQAALGLGQAHGTILKKLLDNAIIKPFITSELAIELESPISFIRPGRGGKVAQGYDAIILPKLCDVILEARKSGVLNKYPKLLLIAEQCEMLTRVFAKVGIIALIDEATGYQQVRSRNEIRELLTHFISQELIPWEKTFPDEYYKQLFRLKGWTYDPLSVKRPQVLGKITNTIIYDVLSPELRKELQIRTPKSEAGNYVARFHQWMTKDIGSPILKGQLQQVIVLMKISPTWLHFQRNFARAFGGQQILDFEEKE